MKCSRCNETLVRGKNMREGWHYPICKDCGLKLISNLNEINKKIDVKKSMENEK